jgi:hypothetical protein
MDFYTALKHNGLGHMVPPKHKQRRTSYSLPPVYSPTPIQQAMRKDHVRYQQTVPPEFAYGHSYREAMQPMSRTEMKQLHTTASSVFSKAIRQLGEYEEKAHDRW